MTSFGCRGGSRYVEGVLGFLVSWFLGLLVSWFLSSLVVWFLAFEVSMWTLRITTKQMAIHDHVCVSETPQAYIMLVIRVVLFQGCVWNLCLRLRCSLQGKMRCSDGIQKHMCCKWLLVLQARPSILCVPITCVIL